MRVAIGTVQVNQVVCRRIQYPRHLGWDRRSVDVRGDSKPMRLATRFPSHYTPEGWSPRRENPGPLRVVAGCGCWLGLLPRCGLGLRFGAGVACEGGCGLPVTPIQTGLRARFQAWR